MHINLRPISNVLGAILVFVSIVMLGCAGLAYYFDDGQHLSFIGSGIITLAIGAGLWMYQFRSSAKVNKREGYLIVFLSWICVSLAGALPYAFSNEFLSLTDAFFESTSGITTTGATILTDIESISPSMLTWRSLTQWLGGMGIIVLTVALFPLLGIGGIELFGAEAPGPTSDRIHPRIKDTARTLWYLYFGGTILIIAIFRFQGLTWFDAINHGFTTMATGGFSTKNASIAAFQNPAMEYTMIVFMLLSATSFALLYAGLKGRFKMIYQNEEWRMYVIVLFILVAVILIIFPSGTGLGGEDRFRAVLFNVASILSTSGFATHDYISWSKGITFIFLILLFCGGCAGSTAGGIKIVRHLVFMRNSILEFKRILHPNAIIRLKINKELVAPKVTMHIQVFLLVYLFLFFAGACLLSIFGVEFETAIGASASTVSNIGPGIGDVGPVGNFQDIPAGGKYVLCFLMICGRLELFSVLIFFTGYFYRQN